MSKVVLISVAVAVGLGLLNLHLVKQLRDSDTKVTELQAKIADFEQRQSRAAAVPVLAPPAATFTVIEQPAAVTPAPAKQAAVATVGPQAAAGIGPVTRPSHEDRLRMMREHRERQKQLMQDPEYREAMRLQARSNFARQYPGVVEELGLDRQQAEDFFELLTDQQMRTSEQMETLWDFDSMENRDPASMQEQQRKIQQTAAEMQRKNEAEMSARFGAEKMQAWKEYQSTLGVRYQLDQMRNSLASQGIPIGEDVSKPMLKALAAAQKAEADEYSAAVNRGAAPPIARLGWSHAQGPDMERQLELTKKRNQRMLEAISPYLSFEQRSAIEQEHEAQLKMQEAQLRLMRSRGNNSGFVGNEVMYSEGATQLIPLPR
jgi:hypothetical protein